MGLSSSRPFVAERSTRYRVANFNTRVENFVRSPFFFYTRSQYRPREFKRLKNSIFFPPLFPSLWWNDFSSFLPSLLFLSSFSTSIFDEYQFAAFASLSSISRAFNIRMDANSRGHGADSTSVKIKSSVERRRCAVLGVLRLKRFAFSPPRNLHRRPNARQMWSGPRVSTISSIFHFGLLRGDRYPPISRAWKVLLFFTYLCRQAIEKIFFPSR